MTLFGPAGNSDSFYAQGYKSTWQAPAYLKGMGLTAYEYSFGRGVMLGEETAGKIALEARENGIAVSAHAPYFINLANPDPDKRENSFRYILESARAVTWLGGERIVVHVGAAMKMERGEALRACAQGLQEACQRLDDAGLSHVHICPETMGKKSQIGDLTETLAFCELDERFIPCVDFAHLHALHGGALTTPERFDAILEQMERTLGHARVRQFHTHFSTIEYTAAGEKRHHTFAEREYGPRFELLAPLLKARDLEPVVICECKGTMAEDAAAMAAIYAAA